MGTSLAMAVVSSGKSWIASDVPDATSFMVCISDLKHSKLVKKFKHRNDKHIFVHMFVFYPFNFTDNNLI